MNSIQVFMIILVMDIGDVPIPLPNVKASILGPVSLHTLSFFFFVFEILDYRLLNFVTIIRTIQSPNQSMMMTMMIQTKTFTNQNGRYFVFLRTKNKFLSSSVRMILVNGIKILLNDLLFKKVHYSI